MKIMENKPRQAQITKNQINQSLRPRIIAKTRAY